MTGRDAVFEPLHGKGRPPGEALSLVVERWQASPLTDADDVRALEGAVAHLLRRARIRGQIATEVDVLARARAFVEALVRGQGAEAVVAAVGAP